MSNSCLARLQSSFALHIGTPLYEKDKIIMLNGKRFFNDSSLRKYLSNFTLPKERLELLIQRDGLQIFIYIPRSALKI